MTVITIMIMMLVVVCAPGRVSAACRDCWVGPELAGTRFVSCLCCSRVIEGVVMTVSMT